MKKLLVFVLALAAVSAQGGVARADASVEWRSTGCDETVSLQSINGFGSSATLVILAYECETAVLGDSVFTDFASSEVSVIYADGRWVLLRHVTNSKPLANRLQAIGVDVTSFGRIDYERGGLPGATSVTVTTAQARFSMTGPAGPTGDPQSTLEPFRQGAEYSYDGRKGPVRLRYVNHTQIFDAAVVTVDAGSDPQLRQWLGERASAHGPGVVAAGDWTGTASLAG